MLDKKNNFKRPVKRAVLSSKQAYKAPKTKSEANPTPVSESRSEGGIIEARVNLDEYRKTGEYKHEISYSTPAFTEKSTPVERTLIREAFMKAEPGDHFYSGEIILRHKTTGIRIGGYNFFIGLVAGEQDGYVVMLPEDY